MSVVENRLCSIQVGKTKTDIFVLKNYSNMIYIISHYELNDSLSLVIE